VATHLYRIAQEALTNAVKHSKAARIVLRIEADADVTLSVCDNGAGLPENRTGGRGMGFRIMAYRASVIGATFDVSRGPAGGTRVTCKLPAGGNALEKHDAKS
jgi:signal transduction histidine kinase